MIYAAAFALLIVQATEIASSETAGVDPLAVFSGDWQIINTATGETVQDCKKAQSFDVAPDRKTEVLTEKWANNWTARYIVVHSETNRVLTFIEGEKRKTDCGDPIQWWAYFEGPDRFRWRRYDSSHDSVRAAEWRRCPQRET